MSKPRRERIVHKLKFPDQATLDSILAQLVTIDDGGELQYEYNQWIIGEPVILAPTIDTPAVVDEETGDWITPPTYLPDVCLDVMAYADVGIPELFAPYIVHPKTVLHNWQGLA